MITYKFTGIVSDSGNIQIPEETLFGQEVEIVVVAKNQSKEQKMTAAAFVNKWAGFLSNAPEADEKYDYLKKKYQ